MRKNIELAVQDAVRAISFMQESVSIDFMESVSKEIIATYQAGGKIIIAGNGGSLCDAMHFAEEMTGYFRKRRKALPAISLSDPGHITCVGNDTSFDDIFSRGVEAHGNSGDVFIALTTSGNSKNLAQAIIKANEMELKTVAFLGKTGGSIKGTADLEWIVDGFTFSDRIQEAHMTAIHIIIEMVERELFSPEWSLSELSLSAKAN